MSKIVTPSYIFHCASDSLTNGVYVCRVTGVGETFRSRSVIPPTCCFCGVTLVTHAEMLKMEGLKEIDAMAPYETPPLQDDKQQIALF